MSKGGDTTLSFKLNAIISPIFNKAISTQVMFTEKNHVLII